jgi:phosphoketolase
MPFAALIVLLKIVPVLRFTAYRIENETMWGSDADIKMQRLIRAHGNHAK